MFLEKLANLFVLLLLFEMMVAIGLGVSVDEIKDVLLNHSLLVRAAIANYLLVPTIVLVLVSLFQPKSIVAAGFLLVAVCPGAPFGPPLTGIAKGNLQLSVGLMAVLAMSSAILAPLILSFLVPLIAHGGNLRIDPLKIVSTLLVTQLVPLGIGLLIRSKRSRLAARLIRPANRLTAILSLLVFGLVLALQFRTLMQLRALAVFAIVILILGSLGCGWILGGRAPEIRRTFGLTTATRNVGVALAIATESFPQTAAVTAVIVFGIFQILLVTPIAAIWGRVPLVSASTDPALSRRAS